MATVTCIRNLDWLIAWDAGAGEHRYLRDADLAFAGDTILHVGGRYDGEVAEEIDGRALMAMPGLVNVHSHSTNQALYKGVREELGNPHLYGTGLYDYITLFISDTAGKLAAAEYTYAEMLTSGITTFADLTIPFDGWLDLLARSGLRACAAPMFRSASWKVVDGRTLDYQWDEAAGHRRFEAAVETVEAAEADPCGRLFGMISPAQIDTVEAGLMRESHALAMAKGWPWQVHASQSVVEFYEMTDRHGKTPIQWAADLGVLGPGSSLGHAIFIDEHSWVHWPTHEDLGILAETGTAVAHCPTVFSRYGHQLEDFGRYLRAGVTMGLGTDTFPHNMIEEMRTAMILARAAAQNMRTVTTGEMFHAATVGGAEILRRDDIGRLAPGAKADLVLVDLDEPLMQPVRDPLRSLIYTAADRAIRDVYVGGEKMVENGRSIRLDIADAGRRLQDAQALIAAAVPDRDARCRSLDEVAPMSLPLG
ncbi:MAG: amidohydrolase family protein [Rhodospirillaceae bacterium]|nr:amidohydrolase family protein [Rhodospirillaceae bacterium]